MIISKKIFSFGFLSFLPPQNFILEIVFLLLSCLGAVIDVLYFLECAGFELFCGLLNSESFHSLYSLLAVFDTIMVILFLVFFSVDVGRKKKFPSVFGFP